MFSLKHHVRRHAMMIAAVAATVGFAAASHAAIITWDPNTVWDPDNTTGGFNNTELNFFATDGVTHINANPGTNPPGIDTGDDVHFGPLSPGTYAGIQVNGTASFTYPNTTTPILCTVVKTLTLEGGGYTFAGDSAIYITSTNGSTPRLTSIGINAINSVLLPNIGTVAELNVTGELTINTLIPTGAGTLTKTGDGVLRVGALNSTNVRYGLDIQQGSVILSGTANQVAGTLTVEAHSTLATPIGETMITRAATGIFQFNGHLAIGDADTPAGAIGKLTLRGSNSNGGNVTVNFGTGSIFDLDLLTPDLDLEKNPFLVNPGQHDSISIDRYRWDQSILNVAAGATIDIHAMSDDGSLDPGFYRIITLGSFYIGTQTDVQTTCTINYTDADGSIVIDDFSTHDSPYYDADSDSYHLANLFTIENPDPRYSYDFVIYGSGTTAFNNTGVYLKITLNPVPEPASLGFMGLGCGFLFLRGKRRS
ncbi:MAG: PEP-CTERM sorting domain-containing protein [Phycisphaerales bacterium]|nr:PEP-CTERM sorting domain-containing protein [Phycisphaerales bacterium]